MSCDSFFSLQIKNLLAAFAELLNDLTGPTVTDCWRYKSRTLHRTNIVPTSPTTFRAALKGLCYFALSVAGAGRGVARGWAYNLACGRSSTRHSRLAKFTFGYQQSVRKAARNTLPGNASTCSDIVSAHVSIKCISTARRGRRGVALGLGGKRVLRVLRCVLSFRKSQNEIN